MLEKIDEITCELQNAHRELDVCETELYELEQKCERRYQDMKSLADKKLKAQFLLKCANLEKDILRGDTSASALKANLNVVPKTIPLVDSFITSEFDFLILNHQFALKFTGHSSWVSLIVAKLQYEYYRDEMQGDYWSFVDYEFSDLTLTKLKGDVRTYINTEWFIRNVDQNYPHLMGIADIFGKQAPKVPLSQDRVFFLDKYIALNAQSSEERSGFGSYIDDGKLVQGTLYGETRTFMVVGCIYRMSSPRRE